MPQLSQAGAGLWRGWSEGLLGWGKGRPGGSSGIIEEDWVQQLRSNLNPPLPAQLALLEIAGADLISPTGVVGAQHGVGGKLPLKCAPVGINLVLGTAQTTRPACSSARYDWAVGLELVLPSPGCLQRGSVDIKASEQ